jgi:hypothetical protein
MIWLVFACFAGAAIFLGPPLHSQFAPAPGTGPGLAETVEAIDSAEITTRILYITAHPSSRILLAACMRTSPCSRSPAAKAGKTLSAPSKLRSLA